MAAVRRRRDDGVEHPRESSDHSASFQLVLLDPMLAGLAHGFGGFCDACISSIAGPSIPCRPRKGTSRGTPYFLSHDTGRWALHLLQGGWAERRADASPAARTSLVIADVRASLRPAFRSLSPCRARLPGLRTQRLAGPEKIRVYVRSLRRHHESLHRSARALALHALHAGLRRPRGFSHGFSPSGPDRGSHRPGRRGAQRRPGGELEDAAGLLGRSRCQRKRASHKSPVAADDADAKWQAWMRAKQPRLLVLWGKYDLSFELSEPEGYRRDVPKAEVHVLDAGHFALDTAADQIAQLVRGFMK